MTRLFIFAALASIASGAGAAQESATTTPAFDEAAPHCFRIADQKSEQAASQASDYDDNDSVGGGIGSGLGIEFQRKKLRKQIYMRCMEVNGFPNAKYIKPKPIK